MDKTLLEFLKTDGFLVIAVILIGFATQLFSLQEYAYALAFMVVGLVSVFVRTLRKVDNSKKKK